MQDEDPKSVVPTFAAIVQAIGTAKQDRNAANTGDAPKHAMLDALLRAVSPTTVIETHGGCGLYRPARTAFGHTVPMACALSVAQSKAKGMLRIELGDDDERALYAGSAALVLAAPSKSFLYSFEADAAAVARLALTATLLGADHRLAVRPWRFQSPDVGLAELWERIDKSTTVLVADPFGPADLVDVWRAMRGAPTHLLAWWPTTSNWNRPAPGKGSTMFDRFRNSLEEWEQVIPALPMPRLVWRWSTGGARSSGYALVIVSPLASELHALACKEHELYARVAGYESVTGPESAA